MNEKSKYFYEFDSYTLKPDERILPEDNKPLQLSPRAFDVLVVLVRNSGKLVEKQDLIEQVWNGQFVEEANIQVQISVIRKALDDKNNYKYIETIPKKGYRFNANVKVIQPDLHETEETLTKTDSEKSVVELPEKKAVDSGIFNILLRPRLLLFILLFAIFLSIGFIFFKHSAKTGSEHFQEFNITKLTSSGKVSHAAISPDGTNLVYSIYENGLSSLWLRNLPSGAEKQIIAPTQLGFDSLIFSPDGNLVYYTQSVKSNLTNLYRIPILNGDSQKLAEDVFGRISVSPDGEQLAFIRIDEKKVEFDLVLVKKDGSDEKTLAVSKPHEQFYNPAWSPDGEKIALFKRNADWDDLGNRYKLIEIDVGSGIEHRIGEKAWQSISNIAWLNDSSNLLMTAADRSAAPSQIWLVNLTNGEAKKITNDTNDYSEITTDEKSQKVTTIQKFDRSQIWLSGVDGNFSQFSSITSGTDAQEGFWGVTFSSTGRIAFSARTNGNWDIWTMNVDGSERKKLTTNEFFDIDPRFTPDGQQIVYVSQVGKGNSHIWKMDADGGRKTQLTNSFFEDYPIISPNGKWIFFTGSEDFSNIKLRKISIDGGESTEIPNNLPIRSRLMTSPDGKLIAFASLVETEGKHQHKISIIPAEGGEPVKTFEPPPNFVPNTFIRWAPDGKAITYKACSALVCNLFNLPLDGSAPRQLTDFKSDQIYAFDWSTDGKQLVVARGSEINDVVLISNFK